MANKKLYQKNGTVQNLSDMMQVTIGNLMQALKVSEISLHLPNTEDIYCFTLKDKNNVTFDPKLIKEWIGKNNIESKHKYAGIIENFFTPEGDNSPVLLIGSRDLKVEDDNGINKYAYAFFCINDKTEELLKKKFSNEESSKKKNNALAPYRMLANYATIILLSAIREIERYTNKTIASVIYDPQNEIWYFPWDRESAIPTLTLSLDIRKSTFAMTFARTKKDFTEWMKATIIILRRIADKYGAIFDKFTGDGVIVHFVPLKYDEDKFHQGKLKRQITSTKLGMLKKKRCLKIKNNIRYNLETRDYSCAPQFNENTLTGNAYRLVAAYACAWEMMEAMKLHTEKLRGILQRGHPALGTSVAIAFDNAAWSLDAARNPVVVGGGIVSACRAVDSGQPDDVIVTPDVLSRLCALQLADKDAEITGAKKPDVDKAEYYYKLRKAPEEFSFDRVELIQDLENDYRKLGEDCQLLRIKGLPDPRICTDTG